MYTYSTKDVCSKNISFEIVNNKIKAVSFDSGCSGNLQGISVLVEGMDVKEAINKLKGIKCGGRSTSCPDQLAAALENALKEEE